MFKSWHNFKVKRLNGEVIDLAEIGVMVMGLEVSSPSPTHYTETIEGQNGFIDIAETLQGRTIKARFSMESLDYIDHSLRVDKLFRIFDSREPFYIIRDLQPNKQILVRKNSGFSPSLEPGNMGEFSVDFISSSPFWQSIGTTAEPINFTNGNWGLGMGLQSDIDYTYLHSETVFSVYNPGDTTIDPRDINMELQILFTGASTNLKITNDTTKESWSLTGSTLATDVIKIDGVRSFKNADSIFKDTNRGLISLIPGKNDILITGNTGSFSIQFITRFYYL
jgi:hypothetical protein